LLLSWLDIQNSQWCERKERQKESFFCACLFKTHSTEKKFFFRFPFSSYILCKWPYCNPYYNTIIISSSSST
jgi:hypothetical protein